MSSRTVFLYDGDCAFCSACARFITRRIRPPAEVLPWQRADLAKLGLTVEQCDVAVQWVAPGQTSKAGPEAIAALLSASGGALGLWKLLGSILRLPPVMWLAWPVYRWITRHRDRMPGGTPTCSLPQAERLTPEPTVKNGRCGRD